MMDLKKLVVLLIVCVTIVISIGFFGWNYQGQASSRIIWEYKIVRIDVYQEGVVGEPERTMNRMGTEGWEFVQVIRGDEINGFQGHFLFKRAK